MMKFKFSVLDAEIENDRMGRIQTLGEIPPTPLNKGGSESLKVPLL